MTNPEAIVEAWNAMAETAGLPRVRKLTAARRRLCLARLREDGAKAIAEALEKAGASRFARGENARGWVMDFDFFISERGFTRLLEGNYDDTPGGRRPPRGGAAGRFDDAFAGLESGPDDRRGGDGGGV